MDKPELCALRRAIEIKGSQAKLAQAVGKQQGHVSRWLASGRVPAELAIPIERETGVSRHELRPDLYPAPTSEAA